MSTERVMLLIDADNVSIDVMEQAVRLLMNQHGGVHVRRAYCTAESAVANQAVFKRLGIKPMVNLATGKNSTDIAMAVDAIDLVLAERPDVVVIASSDSDFAPLVQRLREKGCVVRGIGQKGKVGDETQDVYDDYTVLEHRKAGGSGSAGGEPAAARSRSAPRKPAARTAAPVAAKTPAAKKAPAARKTAVRRGSGAAPLMLQSDAVDTADTSNLAVTASVIAPPAAEAPPVPAKKAARRSKSAAAEPKSRGAAPDRATAHTPKPLPSPVAAAGIAASPQSAVGRPPKPVAQPAAPAPLMHERARQILACMPELERRETLELRVASQRLREATLLSKSGSSTKLLGQFPELFELIPLGQPNHVRMRF